MCCKFDLSVVLLEGGAVSKKWGFVEVFRVYFGVLASSLFCPMSIIKVLPCAVMMMCCLATDPRQSQQCGLDALKL